MKMSKMLGERTKTVPSEANAKGYANLLRAGYVKQVANGIFSLCPPAKLVVNKIENIIRDEMNKVDGQEVLFPVVMPKEMWEESGRYYSIGEEMARFKDRTGRDMLLGMTHEEAAVHMARNIVTSYNQMPFMIYQIQTKFRDEPRSRGGLIRVREFTMKDAYSFHNSQQELDEYYEKVHQSYMNIFARIGLKNYISVASDTGMMGGSGAHEFMFLNEIGEDTLVLCKHCGYKANMEVATCKNQVKNAEMQNLEEIFTGNAKTIEEVCELLKIQPENTCKAVCYGVKTDETKLIVAFLRGDMEVNEAKLKKVVQAEIYPANLEDFKFMKAGNIGPIGLENVTIVFDSSLENEQSLVCGANKAEYHIKGLNFKRDIPSATFHDIAKVNNGSLCSVCSQPLTLSKGVEIGNIFKLGTKYTKSMNMLVHDNNGKSFNPIMGCYGIGVGRALACVAEECSDEKGLVWPTSIAPWHVYLCPLKYSQDESVRAAADELYAQLKNSGVDVILDDRNVSPGYKFADSELIGVPFRVVVSARTLENQSVEFVFRATGEKQDVKIADLKEFVLNLIKE